MTRTRSVIRAFHFDLEIKYVFHIYIMKKSILHRCWRSSSPMSSVTRTCLNGLKWDHWLSTERIAEARWKIFGHVLRSGESTPAHLSSRFACLTCKDFKGRVGALRNNFYDVFIKDLLKIKLIKLPSHYIIILKFKKNQIKVSILYEPQQLKTNHWESRFAAI